MSTAAWTILRNLEMLAEESAGTHRPPFNTETLEEIQAFASVAGKHPIRDPVPHGLAAKTIPIDGVSFFEAGP